MAMITGGIKPFLDYARILSKLIGEEFVMGDRAQIGVKQYSGAVIYFYTHWRGSDVPEILQAALERCESRWDDRDYAARVIFQELIGDDTDITGFGISDRQVDDNEHPVPIVDFGNKTIVWEGRGSLAPQTFDQFLGRAG
jgi:hypothetical protein